MIAELRELGRSAEVRREKGAFLCDSPKLLQEALQRQSADLNNFLGTLTKN